MAKEKVTLDVQNVSNRTEMIQELREAIADMESNNKNRIRRKGISTTDYTWKYTIAAQ